MRSRRSANEQVAEVARRRLELLSAELAEIRRAPTGPPEPAGSHERDGSGERSSASPRPGRHADRSASAMAATARPVGTTTGWLRDRVAPALSDRLHPGASHLAVIAILVAAAFAATAWWVLRADGSVQGVVPAPARHHPASAPAASPSGLVSAVAVTPPASAAPASAPAAGASTGTVVVDVAGKVRHPGIATLPAGSRVVDALQAAGGARRGVDLAGLNLARVLVDGEQLLVGVPPAAGVAASAASVPGTTATATPMVNINTADETQLEALPEVGPVTAQAILDWRSQHGSFSSVDQLLDVRGIGDATLAQMAPFVTL